MQVTRKDSTVQEYLDAVSKLGREATIAAVSQELRQSMMRTKSSLNYLVSIQLLAKDDNVYGLYNCGQL